MQTLVSTLTKLTEQNQVNTVAQTLYSSGILKEGNFSRVIFVARFSKHTLTYQLLRHNWNTLLYRLRIGIVLM